MKELLLKALIAVGAVLAPVKMVMITVGVLIIADLVTGIWAAQKRGERVSSAAMRRTVSKMLIYQLSVVCGFLLEIYILDGIIPVSKIVAGVIGMVEFKSMLENSNQIVGQDVFVLILKKLGSTNDKINKE
jgi:membrane glycosyltransferase